MDEKQTTARECCDLQCYDCGKNIPLQSFKRDNNLYHNNGNPCRAYRIRRHFNLMDDVTPVRLPNSD